MDTLLLAAGRSPEGAAAKGAYRLCCRSSTMSDIAFVAAPGICPSIGRGTRPVLAWTYTAASHGVQVFSLH